MCTDYTLYSVHYENTLEYKFLPEMRPPQYPDTLVHCILMGDSMKLASDFAML